MGINYTYLSNSVRKFCKNSYFFSFKHCIIKKANAFTLAEVLITLGIIGVVAALTMPALIADYRNRVVETRLQKFYSLMNQAILQSIMDNGEVEGWNYFISQDSYDDDGNLINQSDKTYNLFQKYLAPYLKIMNIKTINQDGDGNKRIVYYLSDGSAFAYQMQSNREIVFFPKNVEQCIKLPKKESFGKCAFCFQFYPISNTNNWKYLYNKGLEPYLFNWDGEAKTLYNNSSNGCLNGNGNYCTAIIQKNGWKIPKDYPRRISF